MGLVTRGPGRRAPVGRLEPCGAELELGVVDRLPPQSGDSWFESGDSCSAIVEIPDVEAAALPASAGTVADELDALLTYDDRLADGARAIGLRVEAPG